jgi:hypothetical protein
MSPADAFDILRSALEQAGIRCAIGGSWASTAFGEPRFTNDVDILAELTPETSMCFCAIAGDVLRGCGRATERDSSRQTFQRNSYAHRCSMKQPSPVLRRRAGM